MAVNSHLSPQLTDFAKLHEPGYAILVDAAWGAGKTHAIKEWQKTFCHEGCKAKPLYVSLYGVETAAQIEDALIAQIMESVEFVAPKGIDKAIGIFEGMVKKHAGAQIDLSGVWRRKVLANLPRVLIFDDLEREVVAGFRTRC